MKLYTENNFFQIGFESIISILSRHYDMSKFVAIDYTLDEFILIRKECVDYIAYIDNSFHFYLQCKNYVISKNKCLKQLLNDVRNVFEMDEKRPTINFTKTLSGRELYFLDLFLHGYTYNKISKITHVNTKTVSNYKRSILWKLNIKNLILLRVVFKNYMFLRRSLSSS